MCALLCLRGAIRAGYTGRLASPLGVRTYHASVLPPLVSTLSSDFKSKAQAMDELVSDLEAQLAVSRQGGGEKARSRMKEKGKLLPRERCAT